VAGSWEQKYPDPVRLWHQPIIRKVRLQSASEVGYVGLVAARSNPQRRSGCPVSVSLELLGDRWSLLIVRDMMVRGYRKFREFQRAASALRPTFFGSVRKLESAGIVLKEPADKDGRSLYYRLTEKGIALAPVLLDLLIWGARHQERGAHCGLSTQMEENREAVLAEAYRRWETRDATPLIPPFTSPIQSLKAKRTTKAESPRKEN